MFKDTVITAKQKKRELYIVLVCVAAAFLFNLAGIIKFNTPAIELLTQLHIVLLVALFFYVVTGIVRLLILFIRYIFPGKAVAKQ